MCIFLHRDINQMFLTNNYRSIWIYLSFSCSSYVYDWQTAMLLQYFVWWKKVGKNNSLKILCFVILLMTEILGGIIFSGQQIEIYELVVQYMWKNRNILKKCVILTMMTMKWVQVLCFLEVRKIECQYPRRPNTNKI